MLIYLLLAGLALSGLWLAGPAYLRMDGWTTVLVLLHLALGLLSGPTLLWTAIRRSRRGVLRLRGSLLGVTGTLFFATFVAGIWLVGLAARGHTAAEALYGFHLVAGCGAAVAGVLLLGSASDEGPGHRKRRSPAARTGIVVLALLLALVAGSAATNREAPSRRAYDPEDYYRQLTATNAAQAGNPLFPAGTLWLQNSEESVPPPSYCGTAGCHSAKLREWHGSPHSAASKDPLYLRIASRFAHDRGQSAPRWCEGCHNPGGLGGAAHPAGRPSGSDPGTPALVDIRSQQRGVDCIACHAVSRVGDLTGNGRMELQIGANYPFAEHPDVRLRWLHGFLVRLRPGPHRRAYLKPALHTRSEACAPCHRTGHNLPQNGYKFMRTSDDYGTWQASSYSGESVHGFYPPGPVRQCQDCHDPHAGKSGSSGNAQAIEDTSARSEPESALTVDLLVLRRRPAMGAAAEEWVAPLEQATPQLRPGEAVAVDVVVTNRGVGHQFPAGTADLTGAWLEFQVMDANGRTLLRSGDHAHESGGTRNRAGAPPPGVAPRLSPPPRSAAAHAGPAPPEAGEHFFGLIALDRVGQRLIHGDLWRMATPLFHRSILPGQPDVERRTIQPGESDVVRYRLRLPAGSSGPVELRAQLRQGALVHSSAFHGARDRRDWLRKPRLIAEDRVALPVAGGSRTAAEERPATGRASAGGVSTTALANPALPARFYDYGVGLLLQGDLTRAQRAMRRVQDWAPKDWRGYLGLGRVYLTEGDLLAARAQFERAAQLAPSDPRPRAFLATTVRKAGQYREAITLLQPLLKEYPRDRQLWFDLGMSHYLSGSYQDAARAFEAILAVDPDDLAAHFNRVRCLRRLRRIPEARREEVIYEALREDDAAKRIGLSFLERNAWAERETRTIHEHDLVPVSSVESSVPVDRP